MSHKLVVIGTEHILLGVLRAKDDAAVTLETLGLSATSTETAVTHTIERLKAQLATDTTNGAN